MLLDPSWKPLLSALVQPPASLLLLILLGLWLMRRRPRLGGSLIALSTAGLWLMCCVATAHWLQDTVLRPPPALNTAQIRALMRGPNQTPTAIVVLGAGRHRFAAEYGTSNLTQQAMVRLRYGVWLARHTGQPLAYAGGVGWAQIGERSEAETAAQIVQDDYGTSLRWIESRSRDTRENADLMVPILDSAGIKRIVLVTHAAHMPRAMRAFRDAAGKSMVIVPAPVAAVTRDDQPALDWLPSQQGYLLMHNALHEVFGLIAGN
ncbi:YdcF family protein [Sphaerotilus sp.]|uniref:YdcF family protein n=1 Tax=Sphaerotilus sp. TaxID=2093942 RepID=UPI0034E2C1E1